MDNYLLERKVEALYSAPPPEEPKTPKASKRRAAITKARVAQEKAKQLHAKATPRFKKATAKFKLSSAKAKSKLSERKTKNQASAGKIRPKKRLVIGGVIIIVIVVAGGIGATKLMSGKKGMGSEGGSVANNLGGVLSDKVQKPDFDAVAPGGSEDKIKYDTERKVASLPDSIDGVPITISQQPLPEGFKAAPAKEVEQLAKEINANEVVRAKEVTVYVGTSIKGPQTAVLTINGLLIFIKSDSKIANTSWAAYVDTLK